MRIDQLMSRQVQYCTPEETLDRAAYLMWSNDCGSVPVCAGSNGSNRVVGMLTDRDICMAALFQGKPLRELRAGDTMSRELCSCRPSDSPADVERLMRKQQIRRVPVTDSDGSLVGIVSLADLAREANDNGSPGKRGISESEIGDTLAAICEPSGRASRTASLRLSAPEGRLGFRRQPVQDTCKCCKAACTSCAGCAAAPDF
jgi:CBS domain-containing protein